MKTHCPRLLHQFKFTVMREISISAKLLFVANKEGKFSLKNFEK